MKKHYQSYHIWVWKYGDFFRIKSAHYDTIEDAEKAIKDHRHVGNSFLIVKHEEFDTIVKRVKR